MPWFGTDGQAGIILSVSQEARVDLSQKTGGSVSAELLFERVQRTERY